MAEGTEITILLVDDIAEAREGIKKLLAFEQDFKVVGSAANGRDGVQQAKELKPDIVIMDINMPDMDGLEAAALITKALPTVGVIMMSVQDDQDYMQKAMLAGARFFLPKPPTMDRLYSTIRNVYSQYEPIRRQFAELEKRGSMPTMDELDKQRDAGDRAGHVIAVYSPTGGAGCTTIATNLASALMREGIKTLLVDGDMQFGDVGAFLDLRSQNNIIELVENVDDLDLDYFENIIVTHDSGMKVLLGPGRPALGAEVRDTAPDAVGRILDEIAGFYDFVIVDTSTIIDIVTASILERADKIVLITIPTLPSIKNARLVMDMFDQSGFDREKVMLTLNRVIEDPRRSKGMPSPQKIQDYLKRPVQGMIPLVDEMMILRAINKGVPVIAFERDTSRAPAKQLKALADTIFKTLMPDLIEEDIFEEETKETSGFGGFFRRR